MKQNVTKEQIVNQLVKVFRSEEVTIYKSENECRQGICGWCGVMAPLSRPAYIADFGLDVVEDAETEARNIIAEDYKKYEASKYHSYELEADKHKVIGQPVPQKGSFMWATYSGLKCDGGKGLYDELKYKLYDEEHQHIRLVKIEKIYAVTEDEFKNPSTADEIARREDCPGGWYEEDGDYLDKLKMSFTYVGAVVSPNGRYYLVDDEGYSYARYVLTPLDWRKMFSEEIAQIEEENRKDAEEIARQAEEKRHQRLSAYQARCNKWEAMNIMTEIMPYMEAEEKARSMFGFRSKEAKVAERQLHNMKRANILAMCKATFPSVKFSLKKHDGWGSDWIVSWEDGPTEETFGEKTDLGLFSTYHDTFNGYDDSTDVSYEEFTEFAKKYMGRCNSIKIEREMSGKKKSELISEIINIVPEFDIKNSYGYYERCKFSKEQATALENHFSLDYHTLFRNHSDATADEIALRIWSEKDYIPEVKPKEKTEDDTIKDSDLQLVEYSEKAVAIIGNTRKYAERLKDLGGRFNGKLKCGAGWIFSKKKEVELRKAFVL